MGWFFTVWVIEDDKNTDSIIILWGFLQFSSAQMSVEYFEWSRWHCIYKGAVDPVHKDMDKLLNKFCTKSQKPQSFYSEGKLHWLKWPARIHYVPTRPQESLFDLRFYVDFYLEEDPEDTGIFVYNYNEQLNLPMLQTYPDSFIPDRLNLTLWPDKKEEEEFILNPVQADAVKKWLKNGPWHDVVMGFGNDDQSIPHEQWYDYALLVFRCPLPGETTHQALLYSFGHKWPEVFHFKL